MTDNNFAFQFSKRFVVAVVVLRCQRNPHFALPTEGGAGLIIFYKQALGSTLPV
jgi:hypothetical protein